MKRRNFLLGAAVAHLGASLPSRPAAAGQAPAAPAPAPAAARARQKIRQGVMNSVWNGSKLTFEERCQALQRIGFLAMDLPTEAQIPILKKYGLTPSVMTGVGTSFRNGTVRKELHDSFEKGTREGIDLCARVGCPNLFVFAGERRGMSREEGAENTVAFFNRFKSYAEEKGVTLCMENTNSKIVADQRTDQAFDHVGWGLDICKRVNSPNVKILYDLYHAQISDGDLTRTLRQDMDWICHIHVAGAPGRLEIDDTQEVNYHFIANVIAETGYAGIVSHEWRPAPGQETAAILEKCFKIMDV
ncbi:MAG: TIM barrel protein [Steroidobacteraceae bacterium]